MEAIDHDDRMNVVGHHYRAIDRDIRIVGGGD